MRGVGTLLLNSSACRTAGYFALCLVLLLLVGCQDRSSDEDGFDRIGDDAGPRRGRFNVAFVHAADGLTPEGGIAAHERGRRALDEAVSKVHTSALKSREGSESNAVAALAVEGHDLIVATHPRFEEAVTEVAASHPETRFVVVGGQIPAEPNLGSVQLALEDVEYLAGMVAGAKAQQNGSLRVGVVAVKEGGSATRLANATALGMRQACPDCIADIRYLSVGHDRREAVAGVESLMLAGAGAIVSQSNSRDIVAAVAKMGLGIIPHGGGAVCADFEDSCLAYVYPNWGRVYQDLVAQIEADEWSADTQFWSLHERGSGLFGFMPGQSRLPNAPAESSHDLSLVFNRMRGGAMDRFEIFNGPLHDHCGALAMPSVRPSQADLAGLTAQRLETAGATDLEPCTYCMDYLIEGFAENAEEPCDDRLSAADGLGIGDAAEAQPAVPEDAAPEHIVELWIDEADPLVVQRYRDVATRYRSERPETVVVVETVAPEDLVERLSFASELRNSPDLLRVGIEMLPRLLDERLIDIDAAEQAIENHGAEDFQAGVLRLVTDRPSQLYSAIPFAGWVQGLWYRDDILQRLELEPPASWGQIRQVAAQMSAEGLVTQGIVLGADPEEDYAQRIFEQLALSLGARPFDAEAERAMEGEAMVAALAAYTGLPAFELPEALAERGALEAYLSGDAGMVFASSEALEEIAAVPGLLARTGFAPSLEGPAGEVGYADLEILVVLKGADAAALEVSEFLLSEAYVDLIDQAPLRRMPVLFSQVEGWRGSSSTLLGTEPALLESLLAGFDRVQRWSLDPDVGLQEQQRILRMQRERAISQAIHEVVIEAELSPEEAALSIDEALAAESTAMSEEAAP